MVNDCVTLYITYFRISLLVPILIPIYNSDMLFFSLFSDIASRTTWKHTMKVTAHRKGKVTLNVTFDCKELKDIVGNANVLIE